MDINQYKIFLNTGPMVVPLFILAFIGFIIFLERTLFLHKGQSMREFTWDENL